MLFPQLVSLRLDANNLGPEAVNILAAYLKYVRQLSHLSLSDNDIQWGGLQRLTALAEATVASLNGDAATRSPPLGEVESATEPMSLYDLVEQEAARDPAGVMKQDPRLPRAAESAISDQALQLYWPASPTDAMLRRRARRQAPAGEDEEPPVFLRLQFLDLSSA